jgi:hypothetical protein
MRKFLSRINRLLFRGDPDMVDDGVSYLLSNGHTLDFVQDQGPNVVYDGVEDIEIIEILLDYLSSVQDISPCQENLLALQHLTSALDALNQRKISRTLYSPPDVIAPVA